MRVRSLLCCALLSTAAVACGSEVAPVEKTSAPEAQAATLTGPVSVLDSGNWYKASSRYYGEYWFWVDLAVRNDAYNKSVGILWTKDNWQSVETTHAHYKGSLGNGYERWGLDVMVGSTSYNNYWHPSEVEYAAFAKMNGNTSWDPYNNYYIYQRVTPTSPVLRLNSEVHMEATAGVVMTGTVRVFDLAYAKQVTVRVSHDNWATFTDVEAQWLKDDDWSFRVQDIPADPLPADVQYAVRYRVNNQEFWDNNNHQNYRHTLAPEFNTGYDSWDLNTPLSGNFEFYGTFQTDLPNNGMDVRVDEGAWVGGQNITVNTLDLTDGAHRIQYRLHFPYFPAVVHSMDFTVRNRVQPLNRWQPTFMENGETNPFAAIWDATVDAQGRLFFITDTNSRTRIMRYDAFGTTQPPLVFDELPAMVWSVAVAASGQVYAVAPYDMNKAVYRFNADGHLDPTFGENGKRELTGTWEGMEICYAGKTVASAHHLYILDTCNNRLLRLGLAGNPEGTLTLDGWLASLFHDGTALWVLSNTTVYRIEDSEDGPMSISSQLTTPEALRFTTQSGLTRSANGLFWTGAVGYNNLAAFTDSGSTEALWAGGRNSASEAPGAFDSPHAVFSLPDGSVVVLGAMNGWLVRFSAELR